MATTRQRYHKLNLGPSDPITRKNSCAGMIVIADYIDPINNQRTLVLEKAVQDAPATARKSKRNSRPQSASPIPLPEAAGGA